MSSEEIYNRLKNDQEFIQKLADALVDKIVIKKLEEFASELVRLREDQNKMREEFSREMEKLREDQNKMREEFSKQIAKLNEELVKLREDQNRMREEFTKEIEKLREDQNKMREEFSREMLKLREDQNKLREDFTREMQMLRQEVGQYFKQVSSLVENLTTTIEDDAQSYLEWLIQKELGYSVKVTRLEIEGVVEVDIFADLRNYVLIGEVKSRANRNVLNELMRKVEKVKMAKPELVTNKKPLLVIFTLSPTYDLIQACKENKVFLTSGSRNFTEFKDSL